MKKIRIGVFETNSSSSHSITISAIGELTDKFSVEDDGKFHIFPGEFGWGPSVHTDAQTKASYCYTHCKESSGSPEILVMLKKILEEHLGGEVVFEKSTDDYHEYGYIDHQSSGTACEAFETEELLANFIFNPKSVLVIDNDNH